MAAVAIAAGADILRILLSSMIDAAAAARCAFVLLLFFLIFIKASYRVFSFERSLCALGYRPSLCTILLRVK
jgi:hypothetical protein